MYILVKQVRLCSIIRPSWHSILHLQCFVSGFILKLLDNLCGGEYFLQFDTASQETRQPCVNVVHACGAGRTLEHYKESIWKRSRVSSKDDFTFPSPLKTFCLKSLWCCMMCIKVGVFLFLCTKEWLVTVITECIFDGGCTCVNMFDVLCTLSYIHVCCCILKFYIILMNCLNERLRGILKECFVSQNPTPNEQMWQQFTQWMFKLLTVK